MLALMKNNLLKIKSYSDNNTFVLTNENLIKYINLFWNDVVNKLFKNYILYRLKIKILI